METYRGAFMPLHDKRFQGFCTAATDGAFHGCIFQTIPKVGAEVQHHFQDDSNIRIRI